MVSGIFGKGVMDRHTDTGTYGHTDIWTYGHTDGPSYRDARTHLKMIGGGW